MKGTRDVLVALVVMFIGGFVGGLASHWVFEGIPKKTTEGVVVADRVVAHSVHIVDSDGKSRATLGEDGGNVVLGFKDGLGVPRILLGFTEQQGLGLYFHDGKGNLKVTLALGKDGKSGLLLGDSHDHPRVVVGFEPKGSKGVSLFDEKGKKRLALEHEPGLRTGLSLYESSLNHGSVGLALYADGTSGLSFLAPDKTVLAAFGVEENNYSYLGLSDEKGRTRVGMYHSSKGSNILVADENKKILWEVPIKKQ